MNESRAAKERPNLGKEIKIGVSVVVVLLGIFGYVIYSKFIKQPAAPAVAAKAPVPAEAKPREKLSSGPAQPTVVSPQPGTSSPPSTTTSSRTNRSYRSDPASSGNLSVPASPAGAASSSPRSLSPPPSSTASSGRGERYGERSSAGGPPSYGFSGNDSASTEGAARHTTMPTDPYAYSATPSTGPSDPYALDEPQGPAASASAGQTPSRLTPQAPGSSPYASRPSSMPSDPYARSTSRGSVQPAAPPVEQPPASQYSSPRSYDMYGRAANGAITPPPTPAPTAPSRSQATSVAFGNIAPQGEIERATDEYLVQPNDSYWNISQKLYGNGAYFKALFEHNRKEIPRADQLKPGMTISAPTTAALRQTYPDLCPSVEHATVQAQSSIVRTSGSSISSGARTYVVEEGDTLFDIARFELGRASRWAEIYDLNRDQIGQNVDYLRPGLELMLPPDGNDTSFTRRQEPTRHRE
ncbi:MAG: LysM peptidoglycan-binding domain-containing protein [Pirellulales bacterium]|nr:LysM peptidoglycan-binding domain-containing protein [Pirellulales bacterium]